METSNPKAAIVDVIKKSTNILVTVSHNPSVDALAAALGFTLMLNKLDKHATAVFSGAIPPAISFLEPEKTFAGTVSSLRDFIIALDKNKADRLRYKVEGDVVRIYITPYNTTITQNDLEYSEGDFNVDLVIALGVEKQSELDSAISAHGRILHDATVATINLDNNKSSLGTIDWNDDKASSLCEMLMSLSEALQSNLLDQQIATSLLTGIVAATDRFSNAHTSPRVMTMSAQLMAAGANQQLIAEKLSGGVQPVLTLQPARDGTLPLAEGASTRVEQDAPEEPKDNDGAIEIHHDGDIKKATHEAEELAEDAAEDRQEQANAKLEAALGHMSPPDITKELEEATKAQAAKSADWRGPAKSNYPDEEPMMGGTLNATTSEAEEAKRAEERSHRNHTLLHHDAPPEANPYETANGSTEEPADVDMFAEPEAIVRQNDEPITHGKTIMPVTMQPINSVAPPQPQSQPSIQMAPPAFAPAAATMPAPAPLDTPAPANDLGMSYEEAPFPDEQPAASAPVPNKTLADLEAEVHAAASASPATSSIDDARAAVTTAFDTQPLSVGGQPIPPEGTVTVPTSPFAPPPPPPLPDFSSLPPLPPAPGEDFAAPHPGAIPSPSAPPPPAAPTPGQFQIPGQ